MPIGVEHYATDELTILQRETLYRAVRQVVERYMDDLEQLARREQPFGETSMADDLPRKHLHLYHVEFARSFLVCTLTVALKLRAPGEHRLACTAEELALHAIVNKAEALVLADPEMDDDAAANFNEFRATAFEDWDYEMLFDAAADGIEDSTDPKADVVNLRFNDWFKPFNEESVIHPFLDEGQSDTGVIQEVQADPDEDESAAV
jgi:hypothetical protein